MIFNLSKNHKIYFAISTVIILLGMGLMLFNGLNFGIDFTGGTMIHVELGKTVPVNEIKEALSKHDLSPEIVHSGTDNTQIIIKTKHSLDTSTREEVFLTLQEKFNLSSDAMLGAEQFGPSMGDEIRNKAIISIVIASVLMLIYISFRFESVFGVAAIISLLHDVLFLLAVYAIFRFPVNSSFIAAILTVVGYSINDTIVIFDRIREDSKNENVKDYYLLAGNSVSKTLTRTINTSVTTLLAILMLFFFGSESIKEFALPLIIGISVGTYSSIFIASSVWALIRNEILKKGKYQKK